MQTLTYLVALLTFLHVLHLSHIPLLPYLCHLAVVPGENGAVVPKVEASVVTKGVPHAKVLPEEKVGPKVDSSGASKVGARSIRYGKS